MPLRTRDDIHDEEPIRLPEACRLFFGGNITPATLRKEAQRGKVVLLRIANKDFVTPAAIKEMLEQCRIRPALPSGQIKPKPVCVPSAPYTDRELRRLKLAGLKKQFQDDADRQKAIRREQGQADHLRMKAERMNAGRP